VDPAEESVPEMPALPEALSRFAEEVFIASSVPDDVPLAIVKEELDEPADGGSGVVDVRVVAGEPRPDDDDDDEEIPDEAMGREAVENDGVPSLAATLGALPISTPRGEREEPKTRDELRDQVSAQFAVVAPADSRGGIPGVSEVFRAAAALGGELIGLIATAEFLAKHRPLLVNLDQWNELAQYLPQAPPAVRAIFAKFGWDPDGAVFMSSPCSQSIIDALWERFESVRGLSNLLKARVEEFSTAGDGARPPSPDASAGDGAGPPSTGGLIPDVSSSAPAQESSMEVDGGHVPVVPPP
jgi:hypothetical protein